MNEADGNNWERKKRRAIAMTIFFTVQSAVENKQPSLVSEVEPVTVKEA
jgi:hypothetical protein